MEQPVDDNDSVWNGGRRAGLRELRAGEAKSQSQSEQRAAKRPFFLTIHDSRVKSVKNSNGWSGLA